MKVFIFGNQGNMGKRYSAILKYLGHEPFGIDLNNYLNGEIPDVQYQQCNAVIVATPTHTHLDVLEGVEKGNYDKPVLCEKPIINRRENIEKLRSFLRGSRLKISMVSQYDSLAKWKTDSGYPTSYNYFKTGGDGIAWDCINIIWHAKDSIHLSNDSPNWRCMINGRALDIHDMDFAYIEMIEDWLKTPYFDRKEEIIKRHEKVLDYLDGKFDKRTDRNSST